MWSLLLDFLSDVFVQWRLWKWIHDPTLKGDRHRDSDKADKQHPLAKVAVVVFLVLAIIFASAFLIMLAQGIYWAVTEGVG